MKTFHKIPATSILLLSALILGMALPARGGAQTQIDHASMEASQSAASMTDGEVKKVDPANGRITLRHRDIKHLDMPGMTMVFTVADKALLAKLKPGDKVRFMVVDEGGKLVVTDIRPKD
ncbi:MAG: hypothetical protein RJA34_2134 [Pseudomonadota bacterium]|jgi:Cu/Ag efflux protein CusF